MQIFHSEVNYRQKHKLKLTINDDGFILEQAPLNRTRENDQDVYDVGEYDDRLKIEVKYADVQARADLYDHTVYNVLEARAYENTKKPVELFNFFLNTLQRKETGAEYAGRTGFNSILSLIIPFKDSPVSDWVLGLHVAKNEFFEVVNASSTPYAGNEVGGLGALREICLPEITFNDTAVSVAPDGTVSLGFNVLNADGTPHAGTAEVYFETTGGYLPVTRVVTTNGTGVLNVVAQGVQGGQSFKVKSGFKYYTGKSECIINVQ